jgi:hypothetical protein
MGSKAPLFLVLLLLTGWGAAQAKDVGMFLTTRPTPFLSSQECMLTFVSVSLTLLYNYTANNNSTPVSFTSKNHRQCSVVSSNLWHATIQV